MASNLPEYRLPSGILQDGARTYSWQMAHIGSNLVASEPSEKTSFVTADVWPEQYIDRPAVLIPSDGQTLNNARALVVLSAFSGHGGVIQGTSDFKITSDPQGVNIVDEGSANGNIFHGSVVLDRGNRYYVTGRQGSDSPTPGLKSEWAFPTAFSVKTFYRGLRIGVVQTGDNFVFQRLGDDYMPVDTDADYWSYHPIWAALGVKVMVDNQEMSDIPGFWVKSGPVPRGPYAGRRCWMFDPSSPSDTRIS